MLKEGIKKLFDSCKEYGIDPKNILLKEVKAKYPNLKQMEARRKVDDIIKYWMGDNYTVNKP